MTIELKPEIEAGLQAEARARGTSVQAIVEEALEPYARKESTDRETPEEWNRRLRDWIESHPTDTPHLSDEAVSRESIYGERG